MTDREWPRLTPEERGRVVGELAREMRAGLNMPKLEGSLLGCEWDEFRFGDFPGHEGQFDFGNPPEFVGIALVALDAYATAVLASDLSFDALGALCFLCVLRQFDGPGMVLIFGTDSAEGTVAVEETVYLPSLISDVALLLSSQKELLYKDLNRPVVGDRGANPRRLVLEPFGSIERGQLMLQLTYPGQMLAQESPFLKERPADLWPSVSITFVATMAHRARAREILTFLRGSNDGEDAPN